MAVGRSDREALASQEVGAFSYPDHIVLSPPAEQYMHRLALDLAAGEVELRQLPPSLRQFYVFAFEQGSASRQPEVDRANDDADRLYAEVCRRPPARDHQRIEAFLEAQKHRGAEAAAKRAAELHAYLSGASANRYPEPDSETENP